MIKAVVAKLFDVMILSEGFVDVVYSLLSVVSLLSVTLGHDLIRAIHINSYW